MPAHDFFLHLSLPFIGLTLLKLLPNWPYLTSLITKSLLFYAITMHLRPDHKTNIFLKLKNRWICQPKKFFSFKTINAVYIIKARNSENFIEKISIVNLDNENNFICH